MHYVHPSKSKKDKGMKKLIWAAVIIVLIMYSIVVYGWWQEGNINFREDAKVQY